MDTHKATAAVLFPGDSDMARRMRNFDWSSTPLGPVEQWPQGLKVAVRIMLTSRQPFWIGWGEQLTYLYNDPYKAIIGGKHPAALGQPTRLVWREIWDDIGPMLATAMAGHEGTYVEAQLLIMERNGYPEETYYTFSYSPIPGDDGKPGGIICANTDDTQRVIGERQLALLRELAAKTSDARTVAAACALSARCLESNPYDLPFAMIYLVEPDQGRVVLAGTSGIPAGHPAVPEIAALDAGSVWPFADVVQTHRVRLVPDLETRLGGLPAGAWKQPPHQAAVVPIAPSGRTGKAGILIAGLNPFRLFDDNYQCFLDLVSSQIAAGIANAQAYEEERQKAEALAELDRAKTLFFTNISHEFRTPLTLMLGPVEDMLAKPEGEVLPENRELLRLVHRHSLRLLKLVNTLLDFSRIEAGRMQAVYERADIAALTSELASMFRSAIEKAGMRLLVDCPTIDAPVYLDREMWEKIVLNLLSNAFKFTFEGEIAVSVRQVGEVVQLTVQDTGVGIPKKDLPHVFERFHRVEGAKRRSYEGTGIGMALVYELTKLHGGSVRVESVEGQGTTFIVSIPIGSAHLPPDRIDGTRTPSSTSVAPDLYVEEAQRWLPDAQQTEAASLNLLGAATALPAEPQRTDNGSRPRIVLADDNADMREYVRRLLSERFDVEAVANGRAALDVIRQRRPDLVLSDVMMPELDGFGLLQQVRAEPDLRDIPFIMLSARAGEEARIEGVQAGADDYLVKPFTARELLARVSAHIDIARIRRDATAKLRESERRFRAMIDALPAAIYTTDAEGRLTHFNPACIVLSGRTPKIGTNHWCVSWKMYRPDGTPLPHDQCPMAVALKEGRCIRGEQVIAERPDGSRVWIEPYPTALRDAEGRIIGGINLLLDITDRKQAEQLRDSQRHVLQLIAEGAPLPEVFGALVRMMEQQSETGMLASILLVDGEGTHLRHGAAPSLPEAYNRAIDGIAIGPNVGSCGTAAHRRQPVYVADIAADPLWSDFKKLALSHGLRACWSTPIFSRNDELLGTFAMYYPQPREPNKHDLRLVDMATRTAAIAIERQRAEEALRYRTAQFETLVSQAPLGVYLVDADFCIREVNPIALAAVGDIPGGVVGRDFGEIIHLCWEKKYADEVMEIFRHTLETGEPYFTPERAEYRIDRGVIEYYEWRISRITLPDGRYGVVCYFRDISAHVQIREALKEADRRKDEFLATLAHELRNPLAPIRNAVQIMRLAGGNKEVTEQARQTIERQLTQLVRLVDDLLDVSRITRNKIELRKERIALSSIVQSALETSRPLIEASGHELTVTVSPQTVWLNADLTRMAQVVANLLNNAAKYTPERGRIWLTAEQQEDSAVIRVRDTGIGIPQEMLPHIFEMFTQVDTSRDRAQGGLGIGLTLVKNLVEMHGGSVHASSAGPGQGSEFTVRLPIASLDRATPAGRPSEGESGKKLPARRILVVDDNRDSAESLRLLLQMMGNEVCIAHDGRAALEEAGVFRPDLTLLDIGMPGMSGYEVARRIREQPGLQGIVLVAITGWGQEEDRRRSQEAGIDHHLTKPADLAALEKLLASLRSPK